MDGTVVAESFVLAFLTVGVVFYVLGYGAADAVLGGVVGGLGVAVGTAIRSRLV
jgi:hypothetical protein